VHLVGRMRVAGHGSVDRAAVTRHARSENARTADARVVERTVETGLALREVAGVVRVNGATRSERGQDKDGAQREGRSLHRGRGSRGRTNAASLGPFERRRGSVARPKTWDAAGAHASLAGGRPVSFETMEITCNRCKTEYDFDDALVSERGTTVRCTNCGE